MALVVGPAFLFFNSIAATRIIFLTAVCFAGIADGCTRCGTFLLAWLRRVPSGTTTRLASSYRGHPEICRARFAICLMFVGYASFRDGSRAAVRVKRRLTMCLEYCSRTGTAACCIRSIHAYIFMFAVSRIRLSSILMMRCTVTQYYQ